MTTTEISTAESLRRLAKKKRRTREKKVESLRAQIKDKKAEEEKPKRKNPPHLWKAGESGNPNGRPKGSRNKLTILKEAVLQSAEGIVLDNFEDIVQATVELAKQGDPTCLKIIWDRVIPGKRAIQDESKGEDRLNISISIEGMDIDKQKKMFEDDKKDHNEPIQAEFTEIESNDGNKK